MTTPDAALVADAFQSFACKLTSFARNEGPALARIPNAVDFIAGLAQQVAIDLRSKTATLSPAPAPAGGETHSADCGTNHPFADLPCDCGASDRPPAEAAGRGGGKRNGESPGQATGESSSDVQVCGSPASPPTSPAGEELLTAPDLHRTMDARVWAHEFRKVAVRLGYSDMDEGWLISWFANAIMVGHDHATGRPSPSSGESGLVNSAREWGGNGVGLVTVCKDWFLRAADELDRMAARIQELEGEEEGLRRAYTLLDQQALGFYAEVEKLRHDLKDMTAFRDELIDTADAQRARAERAEAERDAYKGVVEAARRVNAATFSHVDGRDLLAELHPRSELDIKRRKYGVEKWFEGDWLTNVYREIKPLREALASLPATDKEKG